LPRIRSLRANVTRQQAEEHFSSAGPISMLKGLVSGPLRSVADIYIPFRLFRVEITEHERVRSQFLAVDVVKGNLDLYQFDDVPEVAVLETRNCPPGILDEERARQLVVEKFRRVVFSQGFFRLRSPQFSATALPGEIHVPYWVAFRGQGAHAHLEVIDAVRRRTEGAKLRRMIEEWLGSSA